MFGRLFSFGQKRLEIVLSRPRVELCLILFVLRTLCLDCGVIFLGSRGKRDKTPRSLANLTLGTLLCNAFLPVGRGIGCRIAYRETVIHYQSVLLISSRRHSSHVFAQEIAIASLSSSWFSPFYVSSFLNGFITVLNMMAAKSLDSVSSSRAQSFKCAAKPNQAVAALTRPYC